ncbi:PH domain-containing protein [Tieghemostelium lacteum]|uniref:PH domain-containing protein n=1 Tax=Tieghemostelium lacteum TaxID=361077 RepID=A0A152AA85_TIELA|nr:PH domain-containing protein [Tieghemostelium lacteum]|eukprot:KYR03045.1 PH domain-containing protein [Tieghemostelium lacteum]
MFRIIERIMGSSKYLVFLFSSISLSTLIQLGMVTVLDKGKHTSPFTMIFSMLVLFFREIPPTLWFRFLRIPMNDKFITYFIALQSMFSFSWNIPSCIAGLLAGLMYSSEMLHYVSSYRLPRKLVQFCNHYILPFIQSPPPTPQQSRTTIQQRIQQQQQIQRLQQQRGQTLIDNLFNNQLNQGGLFPPNLQQQQQPLQPPPQPHQLYEQPSETDIQQLVDMGFSRDRSIQALQRTEDDVKSFSFLFGIFSTIVCAIYLFIRFLETLDQKVEKEFKDLLAQNAKERAEMKLDTSRYNSEKRGKIYIKIPSDSNANKNSLSLLDKQYGVLVNNMLFLFANINDKTAKNIICFDGCIITIVRNKVGSSKFHKKNAISVIGQRELSNQSKILHLYFENGKDLETWYWQIKEAASITTPKTPLEEKHAKITQKFFDELPLRLHIPADQLTKPSTTIGSGFENTNNNSSTTTVGNNSNNNGVSHKRTGSGSSSPKIFDDLPSLRERIKSVTSAVGSSSSNSSSSLLSSSPTNQINSSNGIDNAMLDNHIHSIIDGFDDSSNISKYKKAVNPKNNANTPSQTTTTSANSTTTTTLSDPIANYDWFNVFLARVFFNLYDSESFLDFASNKITKKINKLKKPSIVKSITLQNLDFGPNLPILNSAHLNYITPQGEFSADATISYHGGFTLTIKIEIQISFRNHSVTIPFVISVLVKSLSGRVNIQCLPPPTKRFWIGFYDEPQCEIAIDTSIGQSKAGSFTNIPKLAKIIVTKLKAEIFEMIVLPNMDDLPLPHPSKKSKTTTTTTTVTTGEAPNTTTTAATSSTTVQLLR